MHVQDRVTFFESSLRLRSLNKHDQVNAFSHFISGEDSGTSGLTPLSSEFCRQVETSSIPVLFPRYPFKAFRNAHFLGIFVVLFWFDFKVKKVAQAIIQHGLVEGCSLGAHFLSVSKTPPEEPAIDLQEFTSLLASYKLKGITKVL